MLIRDLYYDYPHAAYLILIALLIAFLFIFLSRYRQKMIQNYSPNHLSKLVYPRSHFITYFKYCAIILSWILICIALMGPKGNLKYFAEAPTPSPKQLLPKRIPHDVIFLVDASASMGVPDGRNGITRLENAKEIMESIIEKLDGQNVSLYAFTSELIPLVPPTLDYIFTRLLIKDIQINEGGVEGTDILKALQALKSEIFSKPTPSKLSTVILLSDGGDNQLETLEGVPRQQFIDQILSIFPDPEKLNLQIFTIGMGSVEGGKVPNVLFESKPVLSKLQADILEQLAKKENGDYYEANKWNVWDLSKSVKNKMAKDTSETNPSLERTVLPANSQDIIYDLYFQIPLGIALLLLLTTLILPNTRLRL